MAITPQVIYQDLLNAGASTTEAVGIMANMINESDFNPEAVGDGGTSFGLVQDHGNYSYLVTGNQTADVAAQIKLLVSQGAFGIASGSSGADAAGNFAANYEKCVGCQPGGAQYQSRVANAATVLGWIQSGNWPTSAGGSAGQSASTTGLTIPGIGSISPSSIASDIFGGLASALGLPSLKDLAERLGLILFGAAIVLLGIHLLSTGSGRKQQPFNINVTESEGPKGTTKTREIKTPAGRHTTTTKTAKASAAGKTAGKSIAGEAAEAAIAA